MRIQSPPHTEKHSIRLSSSPGAAFAIFTVALLLLLPLRILSFGYLPPDDALRHAARAVSGKRWQQIMLMCPDITIDHNPGWNELLGFLHRLTGSDARHLVHFSVISMFLVFAAAPLPWLKRREYWIAALAGSMLAFPYFAERVFVGRPFLFTAAVTLVLLAEWSKKKDDELSRGTLLGTAGLFALSAWVHGSWYLLPLIPLAFALARSWRKAALLSVCWAGGTFAGALLTGQPITFLRQSALIPFLALGQRAPQDSLVGEFQPLSFQENYPAILFLAGGLLLRRATGRPLQPVLRDPVFWMAALGWLLGFRIFRFWLDWGIPALAFWVARELDESLSGARFSGLPFRSTTALASAAAALFFIAADRNGRWSQYGRMECLDASRPEHQSWIPGTGGLLYSVNLSVFYQTFFTNPHGNWRYVLGFEPSFMLPENLAVYRELWGTLNAIRACEPWVRKMTPADRLVLVAPAEIRPAIPQLEWYYAASNYWVGRLPRSSAGAPVTPVSGNR